VGRRTYPHQSKQDIIEVIRKLAKELGRSPSQADMRKAGVPWHRIYSQFGGMRAAVRAAGLEPGPRGEALHEGAMILDWAGVVRKMRRLPSRGEYDRLGKYHSGTLHARLEWSQMAHRFVLMAREFHLEAEWEDVLAIVVKRFPLLRRSVPSGDRVIGRSGDREGNTQLQPDSNPLPLMNADHTDQTAGRETQSAMAEMQTAVAEAQTGDDDTPAWLRARGLRKVASGALALQMLIAMASGQAISLRQGGQSAAIVYSSESGLSGRGGHSRPTEQGGLSGGGGPSGQGDKEEPAVYGAPLKLAALAHAPTNEGGVLFLFGVLAERLGFRIERVQTGFPDCEAKREVSSGVWKHSKVELEFESRNFKDHRHDPKGCDVIVCWVHNWPECPRGIEVIELSRIVGDIDA
jgi:uncharacterized membrane protein YgcG